MRLAIADPPYPPLIGSGGIKSRASRWYGSKQLATSDRPADFHPNADEWDDPSRHRQLLVQLLDEFDGFAIATAPDGVAAYGPLPVGIRIMAWVKPNATPSAHRLHSKWEPVLLYPPAGRRSSRTPLGQLADVLIESKRNAGFPGAKPAAWTRWVLAAMSYDPDMDEVVDLFPGSGAVTRAVSDLNLNQKVSAVNV